MKLVNYFYNLLRFGKLKFKGVYNGSIKQAIPESTVVRAEKGILSINGKLSCRENCYISASAGNLKIGYGCFLNQNVMIVSHENVVIGNDVIIGPNVVIVDHDHDYKGSDRKSDFISSPVVIGNNVWIGANAVILRGTTIGANSVIGAGAVVKGNYPDNVMIYQEKKTECRSIVSQEDVL